MLQLLESAQADDPDEPFWRGVRRMDAVNERVELEWFDPVTPRQLDVGTVKVECHLYDEAALAEAEARRATRERSSEAAPGEGSGLGSRT